MNSGYKRRLDTSIGTIEFKKPRVVFKEKGRKFQSKVISRYQRRDSRLVEVTLIGYFLGLSCRKTMAMLQKEYGTILSPSGVSRVLKVLDERKREFHSREILKYYRFIWMDGMYVKVRSLGKYWLLLALGETMEGEIELIDYRLSERENEASYEDFLENLRLRGLKRPVLFITDGHKGLQLAIQTVFPFAKIQICVVHKKRDVLSKTSLSNRDNVKCQLVKSATGETVGTFDPISYNITNLSDYNNIGYLVNCDGIESGDYYLCLNFSTNENFNISMGYIQSDEFELNKKSLTLRNFSGKPIINEYSLMQNYPNPFNPSTTISWQSPVSGNHTIKLFDILGREIETIIDGYYEAGKHSKLYIMHPTLPSGVYFYQLRVVEQSTGRGVYVDTKKMMLVK